MSGWKYSRKKLYYMLEEIIDKSNPDNNKTWEMDTKLKDFRAKIIKRKKEK